jgi:hypothetical protein
MVTKESFPSLEELHTIFYKEDFSSFLQLVKNRIIQAKRANLTFARFHLPDVNPFPQLVVTDVKQFLRSKHFALTEVEDAAGTPCGFKIGF